jgi:uncharacterized repeat protein (TIGR01451 family)
MDRRHALFRQLFAMAACLIAALLSDLALAQTCSVPGQAGTLTTLAAQPNSFFPGSTSAAAGATSISVGAAATGVNRNIAAGDLLLIIQMQGADFDATNTNSYGDGTANAGVTSTVAFGVAGYAGGATGTNFYAGTYEWAVAAGAATFGAAGAIALSAPLQNSYFVQAGGSGAAAFKRAFQVVRVPQYARATLSANLTVQGWNGSTGGILAIDAAGDLNLANFTIEGSGRGFRGGGSVNGTFLNNTCTNTWNPPPAACQHYRQLLLVPGADSATAYWAGSKGEGCSGTPGRLYSFYNNTHVAGATGADGYPNGDMGRGAPCNAGGGGNAHNAGGAGGGNGGAGGKGGNSWNNSVANHVGHLTGGFGGAPSWTPVGGITVNRLFLGGGGGAGDLGGNANAVPNGSGGAGGALVILHASRISTTGATINVNGEAGRAVAAGETDAAGGGGAGGTVVVKANSLNGGLTVNANGGAGGNYPNAVAEQDGAGGGGGGGVLLSNLGGITFNGAGGAAGTTASTNCAPAIPANNCGQAAGSAGSGAAGYAVFAPGVRTGYECMPALAVTKTTTTPTITSSTSAAANYVINISNTGGGARFVNALDWTLPPGWTLAAAPTYAYSPSGAGFLPAGAETVAPLATATWAVGATPLTVPAVGSNTLTWTSFAVPPVRAGVASSVTVSFVATIPNTAAAGTYHNPAGITFLDPTRPAASTATVTPATGNSSNRNATSYGASVYSQYNGAAATNVGGSSYSGLEAGPATENVTLLPNLQILKSTPVATATAGQTYSYVIAVQNIGRPVADQVYATTQASAQSATAIASNPLRLTDTLPTGFTATATVSSTAAWVCAGVGAATVTCAASNPTAAAAYPIALGTTTAPVSVATVTVTVSPRVDNCGSSSAINTVTLSTSLIGETSTADNVASVSHGTRCGANLQVTKTNGVTSVNSGQTTAYTVTVSNLGPSAADGATLTDTVSAGLSSCSVLSCAATGTGVCPAAGNWPNMLPPNPGLVLPTWPANSTYTFVVRCTVSATGS